MTDPIRSPRNSVAVENQGIAVERNEESKRHYKMNIGYPSWDTTDFHDFSHE